jgi:glycosyltransferase involved in cell wall biosynthesis
MKVLVITGDKTFGPGHPRYDLQRSVVDELAVVYWGRGSLWPALPTGYFDVVTVQDPFWRGLFGWIVAKRLGARLNVQIHTDLSAQNFLRHVVAQIVLRHADSVRVVSEKIKNQINHPRAQVLPVYIDIERFKSISRHPEPNTILWMGRFEDEKDPLFALEILRHHPGAKLIMLGRGSLETLLHERARGLPVEFPGWQDPAPYLARASVVLCTSKHESFGASIVEALAAGVPVVAPNVGVAREAGALLAPKSGLGVKVAEVLQMGTHGELKLTLPNAHEWARQWRETL